MDHRNVDKHKFGMASGVLSHWADNSDVGFATHLL